MIGRRKTTVKVQSNDILFILNSRNRKQAIVQLSELHINELDLSFRAFKALVKAKCTYVEDIDLYELAKYNGVGIKVIEESQDKLEEKYIALCKKNE